MKRIDALEAIYPDLAGLRGRHDHGRGRGRALLARPPPELLLPRTRDGPGLVDGPRDRAGEARPQGRGDRRGRFGPDEPRHVHDDGALRAGEPHAPGVRQREPAVGRRVPDGDVDRLATWRRSRTAAGIAVARRSTSSATSRPPRGRPSRADELSVVVAKVEDVGPASFHMDIHMLENRFGFARWLQGLPPRARRTRKGRRRHDADASPISLAALADGSVEVIDLTQPLSEQTPILQLPPPFANTPLFSRAELSKYDDRGPAWYWNAFETGEHTGTHFDAPIHWITGRDKDDVSQVPPRDLVGPAVVIDKSAEARPPTPTSCWRRRRPRRSKRQHGPIAEGSWLLYRTGWDARAHDQAAYLERRRDRAAHARVHRRVREVAGRGVAVRRRRRRDGRHRRRARRTRSTRRSRATRSCWARTSTA